MEKLDYKDTMMGALGMEILFTEDGTYQASMPIDHRTCQIYGMLNGGASIALAENLAGYASTCVLPDTLMPLGINVTANHIATTDDSKVRAIATPLLIGKTLHVWNIDVLDEHDRLLSTVRVTNKIAKIYN